MKPWFLVVLLSISACSKDPKAGHVALDKVWRNGAGLAVCPLMHVPIADVSTAPAKVTEDGVTYYLCCADCKKQYDADHTAVSRLR